MRAEQRVLAAWECWLGLFLEVHSPLLYFCPRRSLVTLIFRLHPGAQMLSRSQSRTGPHSILRNSVSSFVIVP